MGIDVTHVTIIAPSPTVFAVNSHKLENVTDVTRDLLFELLLCMHWVEGSVLRVELVAVLAGWASWLRR